MNNHNLQRLPELKAKKALILKEKSLNTQKIKSVKLGENIGLLRLQKIKIQDKLNGINLDIERAVR